MGFVMDCRKEIKKKLRGIPDHVIDEMSPDQVRNLMRYKDTSKLNALAQWKPRMVRANLKTKDFAKLMGVSPPRVTEWTKFRVIPRDDYFYKGEKILYNYGV